MPSRAAAPRPTRRSTSCSQRSSDSRERADASRGRRVASAEAEAAAQRRRRRPRVPLPRALQTARFVARPIPFYERWRRRAWRDVPGAARWGRVSRLPLRPDSIKRLFASDRVNTIAPGRNIVLRPLLGSQSLLLQEDERASASPQADAAAVSRRAHARLRGDDRRGRPAAEIVLAGRGGVRAALRACRRSRSR